TVSICTVRTADSILSRPSGRSGSWPSVLRHCQDLDRAGRPRPDAVSAVGWVLDEADVLARTTRPPRAGCRATLTNHRQETRGRKGGAAPIDAGRRPQPPASHRLGSAEVAAGSRYKARSAESGGGPRTSGRRPESSGAAPDDDHVEVALAAEDVRDVRTGDRGAKAAAAESRQGRCRDESHASTGVIERGMLVDSTQRPCEIRPPLPTLDACREGRETLNSDEKRRPCRVIVGVPRRTKKGVGREELLKARCLRPGCVDCCRGSPHSKQSSASSSLEWIWKENKAVIDVHVGRRRVSQQAQAASGEAKARGGNLARPNDSRLRSPRKTQQTHRKQQTERASVFREQTRFMKSWRPLRSPSVSSPLAREPRAQFPRACGDDRRMV
ncbi:hypothetical protein THAOC_07120, partial [Thalassiosira oceanica]